MDEASKQLLEETREPLCPCPGRVEREDYAYSRRGVASLFLAFEPLAGQIKRPSPDPSRMGDRGRLRGEEPLLAVTPTAPIDH
jgi:hypothetical protein